METFRSNMRYLFYFLNTVAFGTCQFWLVWDLTARWGVPFTPVYVITFYLSLGWWLDFYDKHYSKL